MEGPDHCQCYCYTIMSSLCFPCQVKVHLLHLTASPHGELIMNTKCSTPRDRSQSPQYRSESPQPAKKDQSQTPPSRADCDRCNHYMNFINNLTSGLCDEKIRKMVHSDPNLTSSDLPTLPGDARKQEPPKSGQNESLTYSHEVDTSTNNASNQQVPSKINVKNNASRVPKATEHSVFLAEVGEETATNHLVKQKSDISPRKKPTTPKSLMTTDKMLKRSFDSMAKKSTSPMSSRTTSPERKRSDVKPTMKNPVKNYHKPGKSNAIPKNYIEPAKNGTAFQKSSPQNEPAPRLTVLRKENGKKFPKINGKVNTVSGKSKSKNISKIKAVPLNSQTPAKKILKTERKGLVTCDQVCDIHPGMQHNAQSNYIDYTQEGGTRKMEGNEGGKSVGTMGGIERVDPSAPGEFFDTALIMELYEPPQLGTRNVGSKPVKKRLFEEYQCEPSSPDLGGSVVKQYCETVRSNGMAKERYIDEVDNRAEYYQRQDFCEYKVVKNQQQTKDRLHSTDPNENVEYSPPENKKTTGKAEKPTKPKSTQSSAKKEPGEMRRSIPFELRKQDVSSHKKNTFAPVENNDNGTEETIDYKPVQDYDLRGRDDCDYVPQSFEGTNRDKERRWKENGRNPTHINMGRYMEEGCATGSYQSGGTNQPNTSTTASENQHIFKYNNCTQNEYSINRLSDMANLYKESVRHSIGECNFSTGGMVNMKKADKSHLYDECEYISGVRQGLEYSPHTSPNKLERLKEERQNSKSTICNEVKALTSLNLEEISSAKCDKEGVNKTKIGVTGRKGRLSEDDEQSKPIVKGIIKKMREEIEDEFRRSSDKSKHYEPEYSSTYKKQADKPQKSLCDAGTFQTHKRSSRPAGSVQKRSRSPNIRQSSTSGTSLDATRVYTTFSEYMNPDSDGYKSRSTGNIIEGIGVHEIPPVKSRSEKGPSKWNRGVYADDQVYYQTDSDGKCTSMVIGLPQDGRNSNPQIRINFKKQVKEVTYYKVDKSEQKYEYIDNGTQCDYDLPESDHTNGSNPASAKSSKNGIRPKTSSKPVQASGQTSSASKPSQPSGHQQMYYNRPLMRRSFQ